MPERARRFAAFGLLIESDIEILGAVRVPSSTSDKQLPTDIQIRQAPVSTDFHAATYLGPYAWRDGHLLFSMPRLARFLCEGGSSIVVDAEPGADMLHVQQMLVATALPILLWMRTDIVLHAACFKTHAAQTATALCGPSGAGKSMLARLFMEQGAALVSDDSIRIQHARNPVVAAGLPATLHTRVGDSARRQQLHIAPHQTVASAPLAAVFVLQRSAAGTRHRFCELHGVDALQALLSQRHRSRVLKLLGLEGAILRALGSMVRQGSFRVFSWHRAEGTLLLSDEELNFVDNVSMQEPSFAIAAVP